VVVCSNTPHLIRAAFESVRSFHPDMNIIIVDGSNRIDPCFLYVKSLTSKITTVESCGFNIGHGKGMDLGIRKVKTKYTLVFDSDIIMLKSPLGQMLSLIQEDTYGVGYIELTGSDGFEYGAHPHHKLETPTKYLHPYFALLQTSEYFKFAPFVHHGAPCYRAMNDIKLRGLSDKILIAFPGLGHTSGKGWNWTGTKREFIKHDTRGTRDERIKKRLPEIEGNWDGQKNSSTRPRTIGGRV
jgi:hypothetical protein